jgi:lipopolysaccharide biosynthesis glycosyltransferase
MPLRLDQLPMLTRERDPLQSNDFAFSRWLVPYLCDYKGSAIFMDCDMLVLDDIAKLFDLHDYSYSVQCVKHDHTPMEETKFLGQLQSRYEKKNWSSVMIFNNARCRRLTPEYVNTAHGLDLHQFKWLETDNLIGEIPNRWNHLVNYQEDKPIEEISNLHYTIGGPYFTDYAGCSYTKEWLNEYTDMTYCKQTPTVHHSEVNTKIA